MTPYPGTTAPPRDWRSRMLAPLAVLGLVITVACVYYLTGLSFLLPFTPRLNFAIAALLATAVAVGANSVLAPERFRAKAAVVTTVVALAAQVYCLRHADEHPTVLMLFWGTAAVALLAVALRTPRRRKLVALAAVSVAVCLGSWVATYLDFPVTRDALPQEYLAKYRGSISSFHAYTLYSFFDSAYLWRLDATPEVLRQVATDLEMKEGGSAPTEFWKMPPFYWPRRLPEGGVVYSTGESCARSCRVMVTDPKRSRAYLWSKFTF